MIDQGGGVVWRARDPKSYYIALRWKKYLDVNDSIFKEDGKIGLWTKADAQTYFDDLTVSGN